MFVEKKFALDLSTKMPIGALDYLLKLIVHLFVQLTFRFVLSMFRLLSFPNVI